MFGNIYRIFGSDDLFKDMDCQPLKQMYFAAPGQARALLPDFDRMLRKRFS
jgi:hypothetical protein